MRMFTDYRYLLLYLIPILITVFFLWKRNPNRKWYSSGDFEDFNIVEAGICLAVFFFLSWGLWYWGRNIRVSSFNEQIGGFIVEKHFVDGSHEVEHETCTGSGDSKTCSSWYETVYHREFYVTMNIGSWFGGNQWYERWDAPCSECEPYHGTPEYYNQAYVGKPVSFDNGYKNYIAAINEKENNYIYESFLIDMPDICPQYSDYRVSADSVQKSIPIGFNAGDWVAQDVLNWNFAPTTFDTTQYILENKSLYDYPLYMDTMFGYLGGEVQGDTHVYVVNSTNIQYGDMCMAKWQGGAKNGIFVFIFGTYDGMKYTATDVKVFLGVDGSAKNTGLEESKELEKNSKENTDEEPKFKNDSERSNYYLKYDIRNELMTYFESGNGLDREGVLQIVFENVNNKFARQEMATFKDLINYVYPRDGWIIMMAIILLIVDVIAHILLSNNGV